MNNTTINEAISIDTGFEKLMKQAEEIQSHTADYIVRAKDIRMDDDLNIAFDNMRMPMSSFASSGLCGKLKVPTVYYNRCAAENKELAAMNINNWLKDDSRDFMVRTYDGRIRGCLSASYSKFDAPDLLKAVDESLGFDNYKLKGSFINEERLHLRMVEKEMLPIDGEDLFAGITIDSSDIGRSGLYVQFLIYKQVCTNGLILPKSSGQLFRQKHIGISSEEFKEGIVEGLTGKFDEIKESTIELIKRNKEIPTGEEILEEIKEKAKLTDDVVEEVITLVDASYDRSRWGIINGITEIAQNYSLERRLQLETIAGEMLK